MKLKSINYNGTNIPLTNLTIVVGPNGSGKTTFLRDLYSQFINATPSSTWSSQEIKWANLVQGNFLNSSKSEWEDWVSKTYKITGHEQNNQAAYAIGEYLSHEDRSSYLYHNDRESLIEHLRAASPVDLVYLENTFGKPFKSQHTNLLSVDNRFYFSQNSAGQITQRYANDLKPAPFLALNEKILNSINSSMKLLFGKQLHIEPHNYPGYTIDVAKSGTKSPIKSSSTTRGLLKNKTIYQDWYELENITNISGEGHGVRAAAEIIYALENPRKKFLFMDEPELHLYPATKYNLGRIIASYSGRDKQIILVTHDTELLRGLVYRSSSATVLRINSKREIKALSSSEIGRSYSADILQAAFQDAVVIVEGVTDKYVYGNAFNEKHLTDDVSLQVVSMEGSDRLSIPIGFYQKVEIKNAVIADFDTIYTDKRGEKLVISILKSKNVRATELASIGADIDDLRTVLRGRPDKTKGINAVGISGADNTKITSMLTRLKAYGLFIVPIGSLEDWVGLPHDSTPEKVLSRYRSASNTKYKPLTEFLREISEYLKP